MGLFDSVLDGLNIDLFTPGESKAFRQARELAENGTRQEGTLTGIKRRWEDTTTNTTLRLSWTDPGERHAGVQASGSWLFGLRLGTTVPLRTEGERAVLDWAALTQPWGEISDPGQRMKGAPDAGIDDQAQDMRVLSRLKKGPPAQPATITAVEPVLALGMPTENWTIHLTDAAGAPLIANRTVVPFYVSWFLAPAAVVPAVQYDAGKVEIDWQQLARDRQAAAGRWQDRLPEGSIVERTITRMMQPQAESTMTTGPAPELDLTPPADGMAPIDGVTLQQWAAVTIGLQKARVAPAGYDEYAAAEHGVPPGAWTVADAGWNARMRSDWKIGAAMGEALEGAKKARRARG